MYGGCGAIVVVAVAAAVSWVLLLPLPDPQLGGPRRHQAFLEGVATLVLLVSGPLVVVGVPLTWAYLRRPRALTRRSYYAALYLTLFANVVLLVIGGWRDFLTRCDLCDEPIFWPKTVLLASLFIVFAPLVKGRLPAKNERGQDDS